MANGLTKKRAARHGTPCAACKHEINAYYEACPAPVFRAELQTVLPCNCVCLGQRPRALPDLTAHRAAPPTLFPL